MNIALYIRLSKEDDQKSESRSIINQRMYLKKYIEKFDYNNVYEYVDDGYSGTNFNRPAFNKLIKDIDNKKINTIITKDSSRLGRNISWVTFYLEEYFPSKKIRYISIDDNYDSKEINSMESEFLIFKNLFNDYYCKDISKKIKSSLKIKKIEGKFTGWKAPYGYKRKKEDYHYLEIDDNVSKVVKKIFDLAYHDNTPSAIAKILNDEKIDSPLKYIGIKNSKWSTKTIKDILTNQVYIGNMVQGKRRKINYKLKQSINVPSEEWIIKENTHEAIIDKDIFNIVKEKINKYHNIKNNKIKTKDLINLIYCKECKSKIGLNNKKNNFYCVCNNYKKNYKDKLCTPHTFNYIKLKSIIIKELMEDIKKELNIKDLHELIEQKKEMEKDIINSEDYFLDIYIKYKTKIINRKEYREKKLFEEIEIKKKINKLKEVIKDIKEEIIKNKIIMIINKNNDIYINMLNKIYLSENGEVEILLNYKNNH